MSGPASRPDIRIWIRSSTGFRAGRERGGRYFESRHPYFDYTDIPAPTIDLTVVPMRIERFGCHEVGGEDMPPTLVMRDMQTREMGRRVDLGREPAPTIMARRIGGVYTSQYFIETCAMPDATPPETGKPPYCVPSMAEVRAVPWNGLNVVSTFAGCGGSSLGYRMAGFRVLLACEIDEVARASYAANASDWTALEPRSVKLVEAREVLATTGLGIGELDVLDGSPPCTSFSTAGKREAGWGKMKEHAGARQHNIEDLFFEYARLVEGLMPRVFVAENVSGLVKGVAKGYFKDILRALKRPGYRVAARLLDAQWLGIPQARQRLIFIGVRDDLGLEPAHPAPLPYRYSVREAMPWIGRDARQIVGNDGFVPRFGSVDVPHPTIMAQGSCGSSGQIISPAASVVHPIERRKFTIAELKRICAFPDDFELCGTYSEQWRQLGNAVPPLMMRAVAEAVRDRVLLPAQQRCQEGAGAGALGRVVVGAAHA